MRVCVTKEVFDEFSRRNAKKAAKINSAFRFRDCRFTDNTNFGWKNEFQFWTRKIPSKFSVFLWTFFSVILCCDSSSNFASQTNSTRLLQVLPGTAIHLFPHYGYLSLAMRVLSEYENDEMFVEPYQEIFLPSTFKILIERDFDRSYTMATTTSGTGIIRPFENEFQIDFCEDIEQLTQAYFANFHIEGVEKPWHGYVGGWRPMLMAKYFGIEPSFIKGDGFRYMLVKVIMIREAGLLKPLANFTVDPGFSGYATSFELNNYPSSYNFFNQVGTHYISSYLTGNSVYQVFVFDEEGYEAIKSRVQEKGWIQASYMTQLPYLLPLFVKHIGKVQVLSADADTTHRISDLLTIHLRNGKYPNIFKMHNNLALVRLIEQELQSESEGLLGLKLNTLDIIFGDNARKKWFIESLHHTIHLWEVNL